eukprot:TRINITY_DN1174_c0_g1_i3.p1 TRINITY_DN1174_c0_g1~~TRINITY_DN1174_c0_g1_i3.p1  ORF type:complete len:433 (-),score=86.23 TRINITY_DN1174_c0_g1_i3:14-1312(-)
MTIFLFFFFFLMIRRPPRSTLSSSSAASDVYKRQVSTQSTWDYIKKQFFLSRIKLKKQMRLILLTLSIYFLGALSNTILSDYIPVTEAHTTLQELKIETDKFKKLIEANVTKDYDSCLEQIKTNGCNEYDDWQYAIEKYKLENENSEKVEVPFIKERKAKKVARLRELIELGNQYDAEMLALVEQLKAEQADFQKSSWEIHQLYKMPDDTAIELLQKGKKQIDVVRALNANIPRVAEDQVRSAKAEYDIGEISIQAQTVSEEMLSAYKRIESALESVKQAFELRQQEIKKEKDQIKEDITRLRALLDKEIQVQNENLLKIEEIQAKILVCEVMPKNAIKGCNPLRVRANKMQTEMTILEARTQLIFQEIEKLMDENQSAEQIQAQKESVRAMKEAAALRSEEDSYVYQEEVMPPAEPPKELKPIHHLKEVVQ